MKAMEKEQQEKIKLLNALKHDYALLGSTVFSFLLFLLLIYSIFINDKQMIMGLLCLEIIFVILWVIRLRYIASYFKNSFECTGVIADIMFYKDRGRVTYVYQIEDTVFKKGMAIMKTKQTKTFHKGQEVSLLIKKDTHKKAIIKSLYS